MSISPEQARTSFVQVFNQLSAPVLLHFVGASAVTDTAPDPYSLVAAWSQPTEQNEGILVPTLYVATHRQGDEDIQVASAVVTADNWQGSNEERRFKLNVRPVVETPPRPHIVQHELELPVERLKAHALGPTGIARYMNKLLVPSSIDGLNQQSQGHMPYELGVLVNQHRDLGRLTDAVKHRIPLQRGSVL